MIPESAIGRDGQIEVTVTPGLSADQHGNAGLPALASPALIGLMEQASMKAIDEHLEAGERSVGSVVNIVHKAPTPVGASVTVVATVESVDGRQVWFQVVASDASGVIGEGRHSRVVVDDERFQGRLKALAADLNTTDLNRD